MFSILGALLLFGFFELIGIRNRVEWIYTDGSIYAFHSKIPLPSELVVLATKRFASGQLSKNQVFEIVKEYRSGEIDLTLLVVVRSSGLPDSLTRRRRSPIILGLYPSLGILS